MGIHIPTFKATNYASRERRRLTIGCEEGVGGRSSETKRVHGNVQAVGLLLLESLMFHVDRLVHLKSHCQYANEYFHYNVPTYYYADEASKLD